MILLRLGEKKYLEQFRQGIVFMRSLEGFRAIENDSARADKDEAMSDILQAHHTGPSVIETPFPRLERFDFTGTDLAGATRIFLRRTAECNVFCLFVVDGTIEAPIFPSTRPWFGDSVVLITDWRSFFERFLAVARTELLTVEAKKVKYYDEIHYSGKLDEFHKRASDFEYQREYRIAVRPGVAPHRILNIGDLSDITSEVFPRDQADDWLKFGKADLDKATGLREI